MKPSFASALIRLFAVYCLVYGSITGGTILIGTQIAPDSTDTHEVFWYGGAEAIVHLVFGLLLWVTSHRIAAAVVRVGQQPSTEEPS